MLRILLVVAALIVGGNAVGVARSSGTIEPVGVLEGFQNCGFYGEVESIDISNCSQVPCHLLPQTTYDVVLRFKNEFPTENLGVRVYKDNGAYSPLLLELPLDGAIHAGVRYDVHFKLPITNEYANQSFNINFYILGFSSGRNNVCAAVAVTIGSGYSPWLNQPIQPNH